VIWVTKVFEVIQTVYWLIWDDPTDFFLEFANTASWTTSSLYVPTASRCLP
jgi:hypothetical protein